MTDSPLRQQIAAALYERERPPRDPHWPDAYAMDREVFEAMADAVLAAINPIGKLLHAQLRHAECQLVATQATLHDVLSMFTGMRNGDNTGEIQYYQAPRILPGEYERWQEALRPEAPTAHDAGPSIAEAAANDRRWPLEKAGE